MENIQDQVLYEKCKKIVKNWEFDFTAKKGRVPSKLDIRDADKNIRDAYRTYFRLKTTALMNVINFDEPKDENCDNSNETSTLIESNIENEDATENIENQPEIDDQVWGTHLNKQQPEKKEEKKEERVISLYSKKLFDNSKFTKRNPRSRLSRNSLKSKSMDNIDLKKVTRETLSQPTKSLTDEIDKSFGTLSQPTDELKPLENLSCTLPIKSGIKNVSQSINLIDQMINNSYNRGIRKVDKGWLERISENTGISVVDENVREITESSVVMNDTVDNIRSKTYDNIMMEKIDESVKINEAEISTDLDIISESDEEDSLTYHVAKKRKISNENSYSSFEEIKTKTVTEIKNLKNSEDFSSKSKDFGENSKDLYQFDDNSEDSNQKTDTTLNAIINKTENINSKNVNKNYSESDNSDDDDEYKPPTRKGRKKTKDTNKETNKRKRTVRTTEKTTTRKTRNKKNVEISEEPDEATEEYVMEFSVKPPPKTVPRIKNLPEIEDNETVEKTKKPLTKKEMAEEKLRKKIESGSLNDNFVRIDIQKKVYARGKKHMNFSKYKKRLWKDKKKALYGPDMDMGGCDGGTLTCFKCGKSGHMARQCKAPEDKLMPLEAYEEEIKQCPIPSLEEASEMARNSLLAIHKPNISVKKDDTENTQNTLVNTEIPVSEDEFEENDELDEFIANNDIENLPSQYIKNWEFIDEEKIVKPIYSLKSDGSLQDTPDEVFEALRLFGHKSFRSGQEQACMRILSGLSTLVTLSTGSGKSLCYQLPAYLYAKHTNCISLIISPLVSLMDDQVSSMPSFLKAACLHTNQTQTQREKVMKLIENGLINILLLSPEAVTAGEKMSGFGSLLRKLPPIAFACIDEAHCVSQWSHNFRPSYLMICHVLRERLGIRTILGLTATSTYATSSSIIYHLQIKDSKNGIIADIPLPDNLHLSVSCDEMRDHALRNLLTAKPYVDFNSIIVYCTRRDECERIASYLRTTIRPTKSDTAERKYKSLNPIAEPYHAGLVASKRRTVQNAFMSGHLKIVVATVAFGMGINKSDIRAVIHYNMPSSFESYVQEVGRSGRDGLPSNCHVFLNHEGKDLNELKRHIYANSMDRHVIRKLLEKIFIPCSCTKVCPRHEVAFSIQETVQALDVPEENISTLLCYLELHEKRFIEVLTPAYVTCKIIAYGGSHHIKQASADCPPLAMALALHKQERDTKKDVNIFEFPVVDIAAAMGWDSGIVKHKLKNLEWMIENGRSQRSKLTVQFLNLGFRLRAPGNLSPHELDSTLDNLFAKVTSQEETKLKQLQIVHTTLTSVAERSYQICLTEKYTTTKAVELKTKVREYFSNEEPLKDVKIVDKTEYPEGQIISDVRCLIHMYPENNFTGRAIARIFHGIQSPNYPAVIWGRCKFWRAHLNVDFNKLCLIAKNEILKLKL